MKKTLTLIFSLTIASLAFSQTKPALAKPVAPKPLPKNSSDSFAYALGIAIANNLSSQGVSSINAGMLQRGLNEAFGNKPLALTPEQANMTIQQKLQEYMAKKIEAAKVKDKAFFAANKKRKEVTTLPSGLQYEIIEAAKLGTAKPTMADTVVVNYVGMLVSGEEFENSYKAGRPAVFTLTRLIAGWTEVLQLMSVGDKWRVYIPTELAYNLNPPTPAIPPGAALIFDLSLEGIKPAAKE